jgi:S-formylglutathione hydrolase
MLSWEEFLMKHGTSSSWICAVLVAFFVTGCGSPSATSTPTQAPTEHPADQNALRGAEPNAQRGKVEVVSIPAPALANNAFKEPARQEIAVYLPPSYEGSKQRYPVVFYLTGMGVKLASARGYPLIQAGADHLLTTRKMREMIVVTVSGFNTLGASLYVNSPINGDWEDFVVRDVVRYVDSHYRTLTTAASRGISGHSMGGYGAFQLAMHHPDIFGAVYSLSPAVFDAHGLADSSMFASPEVINSVLDMIDAVARLPQEQAQAAFLKEYAHASAAVQMTLAYGAAFSPAPDGKPPYVAYPYHRSAGQLIQDPAIWSRWDSGWGGLDEKIQRYAANLRKLKAIGIEYGELEESTWLPRGCEYLSHRLAVAGIPNSLLTFKGTHYSQLDQRIEGFMLPFFAEKLDFAGPQ